MFQAILVPHLGVNWESKAVLEKTELTLWFYPSQKSNRNLPSKLNNQSIPALITACGRQESAQAVLSIPKRQARYPKKKEGCCLFQLYDSLSHPNLHYRTIILSSLEQR